MRAVGVVAAEVVWHRMVGGGWWRKRRVCGFRVS